MISFIILVDILLEVTFLQDYALKSLEILKECFLDTGSGEWVIQNHSYYNHPSSMG